MGKKLAVDVAADMLNGLDKEQKEKVLKLMQEKDPSLTALIEEQLFKFEQLTLMTSQMMMDFLKEVGLEDLGLALKLEEEKIQKFFLDNMSLRMSDELKDTLYEKKVPMPKAQEAHQLVKDKAIQMMESGRLILDKDADKLV